MAVRVWSSTQSRLPRFSFERMVCVSSRLRRAARSSPMKRPAIRDRAAGCAAGRSSVNFSASPAVRPPRGWRRASAPAIPARRTARERSRAARRSNCASVPRLTQALSRWRSTALTGSRSVASPPSSASAGRKLPSSLQADSAQSSPLVCVTWERAGRHVAEREAAHAVLGEEAGIIVVLRLCQHGAFCDGAGRHDRMTSRFTSPLASAGSSICSQMADPISLRDEPRDIALRRVMGTPHIGVFSSADLPLRVVARGEREIELAGRDARVPFEHLTEIPRRKKQETIGGSAPRRRGIAASWASVLP